MQSIAAIFMSGDNVVAALPTGAGKTRIAEFAILKALSTGGRAIYLTPLKALSAQVESSLRAVFAAMGARTSAIYSSIGASLLDLSIAEAARVTVMTPEKFSFLLRTVPTLLDEVALIILDEGHMLGLGEREIRYEMLVQKLLSKAEWRGVRLVSLSAALPSGSDLDDYVAWITGRPDGPRVVSDWRPTKLRFGELSLTQSTGFGRLAYRTDGGAEDYFIPRFVQVRELPTSKRGKKRVFPGSRNELTLACAWRLSDEGESTLVYATLEDFGRKAWQRRPRRGRNRRTISVARGPRTSRSRHSYCFGVAWE